MVQNFLEPSKPYHKQNQYPNNFIYLFEFWSLKCFVLVLGQWRKVRVDSIMLFEISITYIRKTFEQCFVVQSFWWTKNSLVHTWKTHCFTFHCAEQNSPFRISVKKEHCNSTQQRERRDNTWELVRERRDNHKINIYIFK